MGEGDKTIPPELRAYVWCQQFLARVQLTGAEVPAFTSVIQMLNENISNINKSLQNRDVGE